MLARSITSNSKMKETNEAKFWGACACEQNAVYITSNISVRSSVLLVYGLLFNEREHLSRSLQCSVNENQPDALRSLLSYERSRIKVFCNSYIRFIKRCFKFIIAGAITFYVVQPRFNVKRH